MAESKVGMTSESITARARARQAAALQAVDERVRKAEGSARKSRTQLAAELGLGYDQYARYVNGDTPLRFEQVELFAQVYGVDPDVLGRAILTGDVDELLTPAEPTFDLAAALRGHVPEADIPGFVAKYGGETPGNQRSIAESIVKQTHEAQRRATRDRDRPA